MSLLEVGTLLANRYRIESVLGQGGMGAVYLADDSRIPGKKWAVKEMWDYGDPQTRGLIQHQFQKEATILATLEHPNLPRITDFFVEGDREYLVMDYVEGKTLEEIQKERNAPSDMDFMLNLTRQLADVLEYLHSREPAVIFRDLKPANIMIGPDGKVKLVDFGVARIFDVSKKKDTVVMGTPGYAAPEQYGTEQSGPRADLYGLGATLYYIATNQDPADNPFHFEPLSKFNSQINSRFERAVLKCVQMEPSQRFAHVREFKSYLFEPGVFSTESFSPDLAGTREKEMTTPVRADFVIEPPSLNFGSVKRGESRKRSFVIKGRINKASIKKDQPWLRLGASLVDGVDEEVQVTAYTSSLNDGGKYNGNIFIRTEHKEKTLPVSIEIEPKHLNAFSYILVIMFMLLSFIPAIGYIGFFLNLISYFSTPKGERASIRIMFFLTIFVTLVYTVAIALWVGIKYLGWFSSH